MSDQVRLTHMVDAHYSPDDGGWYATCYHQGCGWVSDETTSASSDLSAIALVHERDHRRVRVNR